MEKPKTSITQRRKSRPVSELITLFDHQQAEESRIEQWRSENALNLIKSPTKHDKEKPTTESNLSGNSGISKSSDSVFSSDVSAQGDKKLARGEALGKTSIMLTLKPKSGTDKTEVSISSIEPKKKEKKSKEQQNQKDSIPMNVLKVLEEKLNDSNTTVDRENDEDVETDESLNRKKFPLDDSLAVLRREMHSLRKQDVELMSQLLALNSSIQEFKSSSSSSSMSNFSDISDAETEITEIEAPPKTHARHQRDSSGSDASDFESRGNKKRSRGRSSKKASINRDSMDSEISGYYSNTSPYGSNPSLSGYDVNGSDYSPPSDPPVTKDAPFQQFVHRKQKAWLSQDVMDGDGREGSDPSLNRHFTDNGGGTLHPAVCSRAFYPGDERVKKISLQQKRTNSRRNSAAGSRAPNSSLSRSESEQSIKTGYDVESASIQPVSGCLQKWQRSRSTFALNSGHRASSPVQNSIKVDLRKKPPMPGTAIELVLPIQPLVPSRRSSAVRMAERKPLGRLNTFSKRQSMIW